MTPLARVRTLAKHATREQLRDALVRAAEVAQADANASKWTRLDTRIDAEDIGNYLAEAMVCGDACEREECEGWRVGCVSECLYRHQVPPCPVLSLLPNCPGIGKDDGGDGAEGRRRHARAEALWESVGGEE